MQLDGAKAWVDATRSHQAGDLYQRTIHRFGKALVIAEGNSDLEDVPSHYLFGGLKVRSVFKFRDYTNAARLEVSSEYSGWKAEDIRGFLYQKDPGKLAKDYLNYYDRYYPGIQLFQSAPDPGRSDERRPAGDRALRDSCDVEAGRRIQSGQS